MLFRSVESECTSPKQVPSTPGGWRLAAKHNRLGGASQGRGKRDPRRWSASLFCTSHGQSSPRKETDSCQPKRRKRRLVVHVSVAMKSCRFAAEMKSADWRLQMRICPNTKCVAFGRIVYAVATRCPMCKWDLKPTLPVSEIARKREQEQPAPRAATAN